MLPLYVVLELFPPAVRLTATLDKSCSEMLPLPAKAGRLAASKPVANCSPPFSLTMNGLLDGELPKISVPPFIVVEPA